MGKIVCRRLVAAIAFACVLAARGGMPPADGLQHYASPHHNENRDNWSGIIGNLRRYQVRPNESLIEVARKFDLGINALVAANPTVDPWIPSAGSTIDIPAAWILPDVPEPSGIVINIPELRLYYFPRERSRSVLTFPLGIGDQGRDTPTGSYLVVEKITGPAWHVPKSIRAEFPRLPSVMPPGPDNPLGSHALRLSHAGIMIHGTNRPWGIGRRSSHGCLRLYPEDIVKLFGLVAKGTRVTIIDQPIKTYSHVDKVFVEAHRDKSGEGDVGWALHLLAVKGALVRTDLAKLTRAVQEMRGMPVEVTLAQ